MYFYNKKDLSVFEKGNSLEWYLPNGLGGYSSSSAINSSFRKHNGYLVASLQSPVNRVLLLNKINETIIISDSVFELEAQEYAHIIKDGYKYLESFEYNFIPRYTYDVNGVKIVKKITPVYKKNCVAITYVISSTIDATILLTPLFNFRDHGDASTLKSLKFEEKSKENDYILIKEKHNIHFQYDKGTLNYRTNKYSIGRKCDFDIKTGDDRVDNCYMPIDIKIDVKANEECKVSITCGLSKIKNDAFKYIEDYKKRHIQLIKKAKLDDEFANKLVIASDLFICDRKSTGLKTILAGLPWFTDWGRDTMIAFTGLLLVTKRFKEAQEVLLSFAKYEKNGLIPNMFPDDDNKPIYNTVDASLWYFYACHKYIEYTKDYDFIIKNIYPTLKNIYKAYSTKTDFSIYMDKDGLIHAGSNLDQVTWMDVRVNDLVVTPRHGKPVEINALWYNALNILINLAKYNKDDYCKYEKLAKKVKKSFLKFYNEKDKCLYDVIEPNDASIRPNQIWAVSLPYKILPIEIAKEVVGKVHKELYNTYGLRSLSYKDPRFVAKYEGDLMKRDLAYHMGTTWGFLIGGFFDAYAYVNEYCKQSIKDVNKMAKTFIFHMNSYCINGVSEICDGMVPFISRGCSSQAWSVGELLRSYYENVLKN